MVKRGPSGSQRRTTELVSSGADIKEVQEILGHASILSTQVYTRLPIQKRGRTAAPVSLSHEPKLLIKKKA